MTDYDVLFFYTLKLHVFCRAKELRLALHDALTSLLPSCVCFCFSCCFLSAGILFSLVRVYVCGGFGILCKLKHWLLWVGLFWS